MTDAICLYTKRVLRLLLTNISKTLYTKHRSEKKTMQHSTTPQQLPCGFDPHFQRAYKTQQCLLYAVHLYTVHHTSSIQCCNILHHTNRIYFRRSENPDYETIPSRSKYSLAPALKYIWLFSIILYIEMPKASYKIKSCSGLWRWWWCCCYSEMRSSSAVMCSK